LQLSIKKLLMVVDMAAQGNHQGHAEAVYSGQKTIDLSTFFEALRDLT
jgi:vesicle-fusing ATPase